MANLSAGLRAAEREFGETVEAIVVGAHDRRKPADGECVILSREDGLKKLDEDYDSGYGSADCYPFYAWTASRVFFVQEYDGATGIGWVPRMPTALDPEFSGQA